jgi:tyrosine-protein kinase Etk/Wzc
MDEDNQKPVTAAISQSSVRTPKTSEGDEINLQDIAILLAKHKKVVLGFPFMAAIIAAGVTFLLPNTYTGRAVLMPPQQQQSTAAMMIGQLGSLAGIAGNTLGIKNPNDLYVGILKSRTVADSIIERFNLRTIYDADTLGEARKSLGKNAGMTSGKDGLIVIEVDDKDPERAANLANAYVEELEKLTSKLAVTEAGQRRLFFQKQLSQAKEDLAKAEIGLKESQEKTGLVQLDQQGRAMIEAVATLRAQIVAREVEISGMRAYATDNNPDFLKIQQEIYGLKSELKKLERGGGVVDDLLIPTGRIPALGLEYLRKFRDVKYAETIFELMAKQYELAKLDEARDAALIQTVDRAVAPDEKSAPKRLLIILFSTCLAGVIAGLYVLIRAHWKVAE